MDNGDLSNAIETIVLGDFIPFYFGVKMPMLYVIQNGGNFVEHPTKPEDVIYIVCSLTRIIDYGLDCYFSDGHATDLLTSFYNKDRVSDIPKVIDWNAVKLHIGVGKKISTSKGKNKLNF